MDGGLRRETLHALKIEKITVLSVPANTHLEVSNRQRLSPPFRLLQIKGSCTRRRVAGLLVRRCYTKSSPSKSAEQHECCMKGVWLRFLSWAPWPSDQGGERARDVMGVATPEVPRVIPPARYGVGLEAEPGGWGERNRVFAAPFWSCSPLMGKVRWGLKVRLVRHGCSVYDSGA